MLVRTESQSVTRLIHQVHPTYIRAISCCLRSHIIMEHTLCICVVNADTSRPVTVCISFMLTASQIRNLIISIRHFESQADSRQRSNNGRIRNKRCFHFQCTILSQRVQEVGSTHFTAFGIQQFHFGFAAFCRRFDKSRFLNQIVQTCLFPSSCTTCSFTVIIICDRTIKTQHNGRCQHFLTIIHIRTQGSCLPVNIPFHFSFRFGNLRMEILAGRQDKLIISHLKISSDKRLRRIRRPAQIEICFTDIRWQLYTSQSKISSCMGSTIYFVSTFLDDGSIITYHLPMQRIGIQISKIVPVFHL